MLKSRLTSSGLMVSGSFCSSFRWGGTNFCINTRERACARHGVLEMKDRNDWIERIVTERLAEHDKRVRSRQAEKEARARVARGHPPQAPTRRARGPRLRDLRDQPCGARTRAGHPCRRKGLGRGGRCANHGGMSTGPRTKAGRDRIAQAQKRRWAARKAMRVKRRPAWVDLEAAGVATHRHRRAEPPTASTSPGFADAGGHALGRRGPAGLDEEGRHSASFSTSHRRANARAVVQGHCTSRQAASSTDTASAGAPLGRPRSSPLTWKMASLASVDDLGVTRHSRVRS
jgi:hypothetical protein